MPCVQIVATGGTIDKIYNPLTGQLDVGPPVMPAILAAAGLSAAECEVVELLRKDSLEITDDERQMLAKAIAGHPTDRLLITHGTDTMGASAIAIAAAAPGKTVVLTGAMVPYSVAGSDAAFNVGVAYAAARLLPAGVYIAMHGAVLPHAEYAKDRSQGRFVAKVD